MYKLVIIDDEEEVRRGIIHKIDWGKYNFRISGEAENGREALDIIEEDVPDVVVTDINMPIMDGLELAAALKENYPTVITVILTGFDDFKFAQQAIKYGVADYILKPVLPKDVDDLLTRLKERIDREISQKKDIKNLRQHYFESMPIIRENFLTLLIAGRCGPDEMEKRARELDLRLEGDSFIAAVAGIDGNSISESLFGEEDFELVKFAVLNIFREIVSKRPFGEVFTHGDNIVALAGFKENDGSSVFNRFYSMLEEIRQNIEKYLKVTITIGMGRLFKSAANIRDAYWTAYSALEYKLVMGCNKVIFIDDVEPQNERVVLLDEAKEQKLISGIKFGSEAEVSEAVNTLFCDITGIKAPFREYRQYFMELAASISRLARSSLSDTAAASDFGPDLYAEMIGFNTLDEVRRWFIGVCGRLTKHISDKRRNTAETLFEKARDYIRLNYADNGLSIQKVADHLHISSCYLSMIFKKEAGETFLKYLVRIRLDAARDMLNNSDMKTSEIAEKIGYPDMNYFSYFFKKNFGMSPREYRNKYVNKKET